MINKEEFKDSFEKILKDLIKIASSNENEIEIAEYIKGFLNTCDLSHEIIIQNYSKTGRSVIIKSKEQKIIVDVHLDTVPVSNISDWTHSPYELGIYEENYTGLGAVDVKCNLALMLTLYKFRLGANITAIFCGSEETTANGIKYTLSNIKLEKSPVIVMEPTNNIVCSGHKGSVGILANIKGKSAHASNPDNGINAIERGVLFIEFFKNTFLNFKKTDSIFGETTYSVGTMKGGISMNIVPDFCNIGIDMRILPSQSKQDVDNLIKNLKSFINSRETIEAYYFPASIQNDLSNKNICPFWTHAGYYSEYGFDTIIYGPGDIKQAHIPNENVHFGDIYNAFLYIINFKK